jgi:hypothetical protein
MKANSLSLITKSAAGVIILVACIMVLLGVNVDMQKVLMGCGFLAVNFWSVDISKIRTSLKNMPEIKNEK